MSSSLHVFLPYVASPRDAIMWHALGIVLDISVTLQLHSRQEIMVAFGTRTLVAPCLGTPHTLASADMMLSPQRVTLDSCDVAVLTTSELTIHAQETGVFLSADIFSPLMMFSALYLEEQIPQRATDGTFAGESLRRYGLEPEVLLNDFFAGVAVLLSHYLQILRTVPWRKRASKAPFAVVLTFDCDGFMPGQPKALDKFLSRHAPESPTIFMMAPAEKDYSIYDPRYNPADPELACLLDGSMEIGLHSSFCAFQDGKMLRMQKDRLAQLTGHMPRGHRSHYLRFAFPSTWGYVRQAGFEYDMTLGFYDVPGYRNGTGFPIPVPDPSGRGSMLWSWSIGLMDQHLFMPASSPLSWDGGNGKAKLDIWLDEIRQQQGILVLDWHVHAIQNEAFPEHYRALDWLLRRASEDRAWIGGADALLKHSSHQYSYNALLARVAMQELTAEPIIVSSATHASHYIAGAGEVTLTSSAYMDGAAASFLASLPGDALRIADIGCGSGWISHRAPAFHQVLGIDIDSEITHRISRASMVGSLPHLPLDDKQADLVLCTDVIEHLTAEEIQQSLQEFERISTSYIYLQTPNNERLEDGERNCHVCGARWHVNNHLASYDMTKLSALCPDGWRVAAINFTGEVRWINSSLRSRDNRLLGPLPSHGIAYTCHVCGAYNSEMASEYTDAAQRAGEPLHIEFPGYSEIGVLFARHNNQEKWDDALPVVVSRYGGRKHLPLPFRSSSHCIDFTQPFEEVVDLSPNYQVPCVIVQAGILERMATGGQLTVSAGADAVMYLMYPEQHAEGAVITITGHSESETVLTLQAFNWQGLATGAVRTECNGTFALQMSLAKPSYSFALFVPAGTSILLYRAHVSGVARTLYCYDIGGDWHMGHVEANAHGIAYRWLVPSSGRIWTSAPFIDTLQAFARRHSPMPLGHRIDIEFAQFYGNVATENDARLHSERMVGHAGGIFSKSLVRIGLRKRLARALARNERGLIAFAKRWFPAHVIKRLRAVYPVLRTHLQRNHYK